MSFTGKATYAAGSTLPEIAEDVSDIIGIVSPYETPLLDHLGDPRRSAIAARYMSGSKMSCCPTPTPSTTPPSPTPVPKPPSP